MWDRTTVAGVIAVTVRLALAGVLVASHFVTTSPYVYPHYVLIILFHPPFLRRFFGIRLRPWQTVYVAIPVFLHPMGGLYGWYSSVWWFDHLTHTGSATLVAAIGYTLARAHERRSNPPRWFVPAFTMAFVMTAGFVWEVTETLTPLLTVYGPNDTFWDYVFDFVGGVLVLIAGDRVLGRPAEQLTEYLDEAEIDLPFPGAVDPEGSR